MARITKRSDEDEARLDRDATADDLEVPSEQAGDIKGGIWMKNPDDTAAADSAKK
jgi:hypothetical protein